LDRQLLEKSGWMIPAVLRWQEKVSQLTGADPANTARRFHECIEDAAMAVRR
jgi:hypothetical protein